MSRIIPVNATLRAAASATLFSINTTGAQPLSDVYSLPATQLAKPLSFFRVIQSGFVSQTATPQTLTWNANGNIVLPTLSLTSAFFPASGSYAYQITVDWAAIDSLGNGVMTTVVLIAAQGGISPTTADEVIWMQTMAQQQPFYQAAHGGNVDAYSFNVQGAIAAAGPVFQGTFCRFEWSDGA